MFRFPAVSTRSPHARRAPTRRAGVPALLLLAVSLVFPVPADAHGVLRRSEPASGAHLSAAPRELRLTFTERVEPAVARVHLIGPDSVAVSLGPLAAAPDSANVLVAAIEGGLVAGAYTVAWQLVGADGHPVRGSYTFVIAPGASGLAGPPAPGAEPPPAAHHPPVSMPASAGFDAESPLYALVRWLTYLALAGVIGAVAFRFAVLPLARRQGRPESATIAAPAARRAARIGLVAAVIAGVAALLRLYAQSYALHGGAGGLDPALVGMMLTRTLWGRGWVLGAVGTVLAVVGFALASRRSRATDARRAAHVPPAPVLVVAGGSAADPDRVGQVPSVAHRADAPEEQAGVPGWALGGAAAVGLAFSLALSGHAAAASDFAAAAVVMDAIHVLAAGGWIGGLLVLLAAGVPAAMRLEAPERGRAVAALVHAFSPAALAFAGALVVTGVFAAWMHLGSLPALWESGYGRTLLLKLAVLTGVFGTGAHNWLKVKPALGGEEGAERIRRSGSIEVAIGAIVLLVTAFLVATPPPAGM